METTVTVYCPSCYEPFEAPAPPPSEVPCEVDYDCEVCCRPMVLAFDLDENEEVSGQAIGLGE
ncbi:MAG: CPXCG motif-containing cysteine-rich protein [Verrucomicrobiales bacterium]